ALPATNGAAPHAEPPHEHAEKTATNGAHHPGTLTSPIIGIAYLAAEPGAPPFARVGDTISEGQTLLIIEAMKVMNQIRAPRAGRLTRIFIEDTARVAYRRLRTPAIAMCRRCWRRRASPATRRSIPASAFSPRTPISPPRSRSTALPLSAPHPTISG